MKKNEIYRIIWCVWLCGWLGCLGISFLNWKFWAIYLPVLILVQLEKGASKNDE
jgi:hypothetical protein